MRQFTYLGVLLFAACSAPAPTDPPPEAAEAQWTRTAYVAETIHTGVNGTEPAKVVVVTSDGVIEAVHPDLEAAGLSDSDEIVDFGSATLFPGFTDGHVHLLGIGQRELTLDLAGTASLAELVTRVETELEGVPEGQVLFGRGWIENDWPERRMPTIADLDPVSPDNPVILTRADGHAMAVNSAALKAAGINFDTLDPSGGMIERRDDGRATGMLIDNAMGLVMPLIAEPTEADIVSALAIGAETYAARGWTNVHNMSVNPAHAPLLERLDLEGRIPIRLHNAFDSEGFAIAAGRRHETDTIQNRAVKLYMDGALGSRGAQLVEPYADRPETSGLSLIDDDDLEAAMRRAAEQDVQLAIHAIGDLANKRIIDTVEASFPDAAESLRWRIEHTQILRPDDIARVAGANLIASMQPSHAIGDLKFAPDRLGMNRLAGAYAWRDLIDEGAILVGGSDAPVEVGSPLIEFYAAVARKDVDGGSGDGWHPEQAVTRQEALKMFTVWPAYASFQEEILGTIEPGKLADFSVFDRDLMSIAEAEILDAEAVATIVGGEIVWRVGE